jgi:hypothetical protein
MPTMIQPSSADLAYACSPVETPGEPMLHGSSHQILHLAEQQVRDAGPVYERLWVGDRAVVWPRVGQVLFSLAFNEPIEVALERDPLPFTHLYVGRQASAVLGLPWTLAAAETRICRSIDLLEAAVHPFKPHVTEALSALPERSLDLSRPSKSLGFGWWRVQPSKI